MDIIQVLELLKPESHVMTVQVSSPKSFGYWLVSLSPAFIGILALIFSARQFKASVRSQYDLAKLNARVETEGKIKESWCNSVREHCAKYLSAVNNSMMISRDMDIYLKKLKVRWMVNVMMSKLLLKM